jgi:hypothetical protein
MNNKRKKKTNEMTKTQKEVVHKRSHSKLVSVL